MELGREYLIKEGFVFMHGDCYQHDYCPEFGRDDPYRWMLSVSPHNRVRLKESCIEIDTVEKLLAVYEFIKNEPIMDNDENGRDKILNFLKRNSY